MKELIGKTIQKALINEDQSLIAFVTEVGNIYFIAQGDCCSETWFSDILNVTNIFNAKVTSVRSIELPEYNVEDGRTRQQYDSVYGYKLVSAKGETTVIFRNSSNGYYGGYVELYLGPVMSLESFEEIHSDDWKA